MLIGLFRRAGATGHVFFLKGGHAVDKGLAYSGFYGPRTTIAVVPTTPQIIPFAIEARTQDKQRVMVQGDLTVTLNPKTAISKFDFTVDGHGGGFVGEWHKVLNAKVIENVLRAVLARVKELDVETATRSQRDVEGAITEALGQVAFGDDGIVIKSCSIPKIIPRDTEVDASIGAQERQVMLTQADLALHGRRMKGAENERTVKEYEAETVVELEKKKGFLLDEQDKNKRREAEIDAAATGIRLTPLKEIDPGTLLGAALMEGLKDGRVESIVIAPELLGALQQKR